MTTLKDFKNEYFAGAEAEDAVEHLISKGSTWYSNLLSNQYLEKVKRSWNSYHGFYFGTSHEITSGGEQGELTNIAVNHYRNLATHMLNMVTATRPAFRAKAVNTDHRSQSQVSLANGLLDYYMRDKRLEENLKLAVEYAIVLGTGYIKMEWNQTLGEVYDYQEIDPILDEDGEPRMNDEGEFVDENDRVLTPYPIREGDVQFTNLSPFDVVFDSTKETAQNHDWVICRSFQNRFNLAKKYPDYEDEILNIKAKNEGQQGQQKFSLSPYDETVDIPVYEFFHKETEALPNGRYLLYLEDSTVLFDSPMPYKRLPIYRISPASILGTPYGYTSMFDLLSLQDATNVLYSTIFSNQSTFGVQNVANPTGNNVKYTNVAGGMNFLEYEPVEGAVNGGMPTPLNLTSTPAEVFTYLQLIEKVMETISGVNSVARGTPDTSLTSGTALALVQAQALQFMSGLQQSYIMLVEDVGTGLVKLLQDFAEVPRIAEIAGIANRHKMKEFASGDLDKISRVIVDVGNPLSQSAAGRLQMGENLLQMGLVTSPEMYLSILNTGNIDTMVGPQFDENLLIQDENEYILSGEEKVVAIITDKHELHIRQHKALLNSTEARNDPGLVARTLSHIQQHIDLKRTNPDLLAILGEQALGPAQGSPVSQKNVQPEMPPASSTGQNPILENPMMEGGTQGTPGAAMPKLPQVPKGPDGSSLLPTERG